MCYLEKILDVKEGYVQKYPWLLDVQRSVASYVLSVCVRDTQQAAGE